jgi:hypothetical protein
MQVLRGNPSQKRLQELGLAGVEVAFWGFANTDIYQCTPTDTLHQDFNGISRHLIEALLSCVEEKCRSKKDAIFTKIRDRLASYRRVFHGQRIPKESLWAEKMCAEVGEGGRDKVRGVSVHAQGPLKLITLFIYAGA